MLNVAMGVLLGALLLCLSFYILGGFARGETWKEIFTRLIHC